jgi:hypothetical protein
MKCLGIIGAMLLLAVASQTAFTEENTTQVSTISIVNAPTPAPPRPGDKTGTLTIAQQPSEEAFVAPAPPPPEEPKPWKIPQPCLLQKLGIDMSGWVQQGITFNAWNPVDRFNGPVYTNDRSGEYMLNQAWLAFVRPTKTDGDGWDIGGRIDVVYGEDWRYGQCEGLETTFDDPNSFYGLILPQFYLEVAYNDLTVKMGHFATMTSLEKIPAPMNFFYSHSYLMGGYYDPLLVTGLQAEYKISERLTAVGGFNRGWMNFENDEGTLNFLGGIRWTNDDKKSTLSAMVIAGPTMTFAGFHDVDNFIVVYTRKFTDRFWSGTQVTVGRENDGSVVDPGQDDSWYGFEQIFTYKLNNPKWEAGLRYEWVQDNGGSRVGGIGNILGTGRGWTGKPGFAGALSDLSLGLNYHANLNCVLRPEIRWDWYNGDPNPAGQLPFNTFNNRSQFTAAMDLIVTF